MSRGLLARVVLLALGGVGALLWQNGALFPKERQVSWQLGRFGAEARELDIQLYDDGGALLKRETWTFEGPPPPNLLQVVALKEGRYPARVFARLADGSTQVTSPVLNIASEASVSVRLERGTSSR